MPEAVMQHHLGRVLDVVSGPADRGSLVIHAETRTAVRSVRGRRGAQDVALGEDTGQEGPCMTRAEPTRSRTISAAASDMGLSGVVSMTRVCIISPTVWARRPSSATFADLEQLGVVRRGRPGELLGEQPPQRPGPGRQLRPAHPEQLERRLVKLGMCLVRADRVGEVLELMDQFEEPGRRHYPFASPPEGEYGVGRGSPGRPGRTDVTPSGMIHTPKARQRNEGNGRKFSRPPDKWALRLTKAQTAAGGPGRRSRATAAAANISLTHDTM